MQQNLSGFSERDLEAALREKAQSLLQNGTVTRVLGFRKGLFDYDVTPSVFDSAKDIDKNFVYNEWCGANFSKYCAEQSRLIETKKATAATNARAQNAQPPHDAFPKERVLAFLKPCDTYSFNLLLKEHRIVRENIYIVAVPCMEFRKIDESQDTQNARSLERCTVCKSTKHVVYDELIGKEGAVQEDAKAARFSQVAKLESMSVDERYAFWRAELSRCIRCNACRNVCPACTCETCVFDNPSQGVAQKTAANAFEENLFHIIRAFHVAGRCTDCGECSRVCPEHIPLHLLNRKFIKDINTFYGEYQSGECVDDRSPLTSYDVNDCEPSVIYNAFTKGTAAATLKGAHK